MPISPMMTPFQMTMMKDLKKVMTMGACGKRQQYMNNLISIGVGKWQNQSETDTFLQSNQEAESPARHHHHQSALPMASRPVYSQ